jgi:TonB-dependent starch-binding outer membrane protein SusC
LIPFSKISTLFHHILLFNQFLFVIVQFFSIKTILEMTIKRLLLSTALLLTMILIGHMAFAQDQKVTGKVTNSTDGTPLLGASISVKGTNIGTQTGSDGYFRVSVPQSANTLIITSVGFAKQEIDINGKSSVDISLVATDVRYNEVVVVGYTSQKKASITGAVSTVNMNDLSKTRIADVAQALQGQVAGVFVAANTGAPGDGIKIRIRGEGTLGNNEVLYIVDGVPTRDISFLSSSDIKSMTVLKDASATAIYGSRAAGGVVVITTQSGQKGKMNIVVDYYTGFHMAANPPKMLNADQYLTVKDMAWHNTSGNAANAISPYKADRSRTDLANTDWQSELFNTGRSNSLQVSASGGTDAIQY